MERQQYYLTNDLWKPQVFLQWASQGRALTLSARGEFVNDLSFPQRLQVPASWHFPVPFSIFVPAKARLHFQIHSVVSVSCKNHFMFALWNTEINKRRAPFPGAQPHGEPSALVWVSVQSCEVTAEQVIGKTVLNFALECPRILRDVCWCSPQASANSFPIQATAWQSYKHRKRRKSEQPK